jgi:hypothetical protein
MANARCINAAQVQARAVDCTPASSGPAACGGVGPGSEANWSTERACREQASP